MDASCREMCQCKGKNNANEFFFRLEDFEFQQDQKEEKIFWL